MPKPLSLTVDVEQLAFGRVFQTLDGMPGVINIRILANGPKRANVLKPPKKKGNGTVSNPTAKQLVLAALGAGPQSKATLQELFERNGKKATTVPYAVQETRRLKYLKSNGRGNYEITAAGRTALMNQQEAE